MANLQTRTSVFAQASAIGIDLVSLNFSSRVMLFCLDGVTHDGKSRWNRRNKALRCAFDRQIIITNPLARSRGYWDIRVPTSDGKTGCFNHSPVPPYRRRCRPVLPRQAVGRMAGRAGKVARLIRPLGAEGAVAPGQGKVNAQPVLPPPFGPLALGLRLALVVLVRDDLNRLFRLREEPSPRTSCRKNCVSTRPP